MRTKLIISLLLCMLLSVYAHALTKKELSETSIPEFLENQNGVLIPVPTADGTGFPNYIKIFSMSEKDIKNLQPGLFTKIPVYVSSFTIGTAVGLAEKATKKDTKIATSGSSLGDTGPQERRLTKDEMNTQIATYKVLKKAGYKNDMAQLYAEYYLANNIKPFKEISMDRVSEQLFSFYIYRKLGGLLVYEKFRKINSKHLEKIEALFKEQHVKNQIGRPLSPAEFDRVYYECFTRNDSGERAQYRKALIEYRVKNNIPSPYISVDDYERCLMAYSDKHTNEDNDFLEFEYDYLKNMAANQ